MSPTEELLKRLKNIRLLAIQAEEGIASNLAVQKTHPDRLKQAESYLKLAVELVKEVREEDEVGLAYWQEIEDVFPVIIDRLNNHIVIQQNLDFIQATDKVYLAEFLKYVLLYGRDLLKEVIEAMPDEDKASIKGLLGG